MCSAHSWTSGDLATTGPSCRVSRSSPAVWAQRATTGSSCCVSRSSPAVWDRGNQTPRSTDCFSASQLLRRNKPLNKPQPTAPSSIYLFSSTRKGSLVLSKRRSEKEPPTLFDVSLLLAVEDGACGASCQSELPESKRQHVGWALGRCGGVAEQFHRHGKPHRRARSARQPRGLDVRCVLGAECPTTAMASVSGASGWGLGRIR